MHHNLWNPYRSPPADLKPQTSGGPPSYQVRHPPPVPQCYGNHAVQWPNQQDFLRMMSSQSVYPPRPLVAPHGMPQGFRFQSPWSGVRQETRPNYSRGRGGGSHRGSSTQQIRGRHMRGPYGAASGPRQHYQRPTQQFHPHPNSIYCEACDMEFKTRQKYNEHVQKHVKCPKCDFVGIFDTIEEHFEMVHLSALLKKGKAIETEEDLVRWRQERSRKYPRTKKPKVLGTSNQNQRGVPPPSVSSGNSAHLSDGEIEDKPKPSSVPNGVTKVPVNGLASLISCYASSDSEPEEVPIVKKCLSLAPENPTSALSAVEAVPLPTYVLTELLPEIQQNGEHVIPSTLPNHSFVECLLAKEPLQPEVRNAQSPQSQRRTVQPNRTGFARGSWRPVPRKPRSLYEKLVAQDIERDNDILLQCIIHLCKNGRI